MRAKEITGKLETITDEPSTVRAVYLRPPSTRVSTTGLIVDELVRIPVDDNGNFVKKIAYGAGILVLVGEGGLHR
ncbi:adhesin, partial [Corynebacterium ulcerans]|nr:adhesin [Corynebacterium ulcerans]